MIHYEGLIKIAMMINGSIRSEPLVIHLNVDFPGYQPIVLDSARWFLANDGYVEHDQVSFTLHNKVSVSIKEFTIKFLDGTSLYTEILEQPINLFYLGDEAKITPRYKLVEVS